MATVIYEPEDPSGIGPALGEGLSSYLDVKAKDALRKKEEDRFKATIKDIEKSGSRQEAFSKAASQARNSKEFLELSQAVENFFPTGSAPKTSETELLFTDSQTGEQEVRTVLTTAGEQSSEKALTEKFGQGKFTVRVANKGKEAKDWVDKETGAFIGRGITAPNDTSEPLEVFKARQAAEKGGGKSDIFDKDGRLKNEVVGTVDKLINGYLSPVDSTTGFAPRANPVLKSAALDEFTRLMESGEEKQITTAVTKAVNFAYKSNPDIDPLPLTQKEQDKMSEQIRGFEQGIELIDDQMLTLGRAVGVPASTKSLIDYVWGLTTGFGTELVFPETAEAKTSLDLLERTLTEMLSISDRFPAWEQALLKNRIPTSEQWFKSPEKAASQLKEIRDYMVSKREMNAHHLGVEIPDLPTLKDRITRWPLEKLRYLDIDILTGEERRTLWDRLDELGAPQ